MHPNTGRRTGSVKEASGDTSGGKFLRARAAGARALLYIYDPLRNSPVGYSIRRISGTVPGPKVAQIQLFSYKSILNVHNARSALPGTLFIHPTPTPTRPHVWPKSARRPLHMCAVQLYGFFNCPRGLCTPIFSPLSPLSAVSHPRSVRGRVLWKKLETIQKHTCHTNNGYMIHYITYT